MELPWAEAVCGVQRCVDGAELALNRLYEAYDPTTSGGGNRQEEELRGAHALLADHSHALTCIQDGARCALAVCDTIKQVDVVEAR